MQFSREINRWWITGLLFLATTINYMDRVTLSGVSVRVTAELGLTDLEYGNLELAFGWAFAAGSVTFGFLADRIRVYVLYPTVLGLWSLVGMATGSAEGFAGLLIFRSLLGFFEAGHWPCALKTSFAALDSGQRTLGNSILQSGASIGAILTPQVIRLLLDEGQGSWRRPFVVCGFAGLAWVFAWLIAMRRHRATSTSPSAGSNSLQNETLWVIFRQGRFWAVAILVLGAQMVWHVYRVWLMKFLQSGRGLEESAALNFTSAYYLATDLGCLLAGFASLQFVRRMACSPHQAVRRVYAAGCVCTSLCMCLPWLKAGVLLKLVLLVIGAGALSLFPCYYSLVQELSSTHVGRVTGILSLWVWAVTSPLHTLFGKLADQTRSYDAGLVLAGLAPWIGVIALKSLWKQTNLPESQKP